jgi:cell wall-associated NlpC family hydrolase
MPMRAFHETCCWVAMATAAVVLGACSVSRPKPQPTAFVARPHHKGDSNANDILFRAIGLVGTPYRYGGNTPQSGFDCSGLVDYVFRDVAGIDLPRTAHDISRIDAPQIKRNQLESGDLVFFRGAQPVSHVGIYVGRGRFVHAPNEGGTVRLDFLDAPYWNEHFSGALRVVL